MPCALTHPLPSSLAIIPIHGSHQELQVWPNRSALWNTQTTSEVSTIRFHGIANIYWKKKSTLSWKLDIFWQYLMISLFLTSFVSVEEKDQLNHCCPNFLMLTPLMNHFHSISFFFYFHHNWFYCWLMSMTYSQIAEWLLGLASIPIAHHTLFSSLKTLSSIYRLILHQDFTVPHLLCLIQTHPPHIPTTCNIKNISSYFWEMWLYR